ncbi:MAG: ATP-binding protein [Chloroflexota bacterium]
MKPSLKIDDMERAREHVRNLRRIQESTAQLALIDDLNQLHGEIVRLAAELLPVRRILLLVRDEMASIEMRPAAIHPPLPQPTVSANSRIFQQPEPEETHLFDLRLHTEMLADHPIMSAWLAGHPFFANLEQAAVSPITSLLQTTGFTSFFSVPLMGRHETHGVLIIDQLSEQPETALAYDVLRLYAANCGVILHMLLRHRRTVEQLVGDMQEMDILQQIDHELNETIALPRVFDMALDWALRFTNARAASIALYNDETDSLRFERNYGYAQTNAELEALRADHSETVTHRVARRGIAEIVRNTDNDPRAGWFAPELHSQIAVPVVRDERVIAVITLESNKHDGFTPQHLSFLQKLASRAAVAIDNARLHTETVRERERLSTILESIADVVIVVDTAHRIVMISQSAINALRLYSGVDYTGRPFTDVITYMPLEMVYTQSLEMGEGFEEEINLPNGRDYYVKVVPMPSIGHALVMQDVTPYKEMDRLKSDLVATVSHDLKQPLSVMRGYIDLLQMKNTFDPGSLNFIEKLEQSIVSMRHLIDDVLDLARIESGAELDFEHFGIGGMIKDCIESNRQSAEQKAMSLITDLPRDLPFIDGDPVRLAQIFNNLISNAIKYTPPEGRVHIAAEKRRSTVRVMIRDNGMGISPEDQAHIFERFYRVRRPETDSIEGTGLGLAIVRKLVEAHQGRIRVESKLGEGSTFIVTLPIQQSINGRTE